MTAPVMTESGIGGHWKMSFSMPSKYTMDTLPTPNDKRVKLIQTKTKTVAVIRYSGRFGNAETRRRKTQALMAWVEGLKGFRASGVPFYAGYDPPFTIPSLRRNEVLIELVPRT